MTRIQHILFVICFLGPFQSLIAQKKIVAHLPKDINEASGLVFLNDSVLVTHNDGGDEPILYFINLKGEEIHRVKVDGATNIDWEDITMDNKGYLYIGDIGNNDNNRKDLCIYKVNSKGILKKDTVKSSKISFSYANQEQFPPEKPDLHFDAEGMAFFNDSLYIFTKCRTVPFDGKSYGYVISTKPGVYNLTKQFEILIGKDGWWKDSVTAADMRDGKCYILTYNRLIVYSFSEGVFKLLRSTILDPVSQIEAVAVNSKGIVYIADEQQKLLGGRNLYKVKDPKPKKSKKKK